MSYSPPPPPPPPGGGFPPPTGGTPYGGGATHDYAEPVPRILAGLVDYVALSLLAGILIGLRVPVIGYLLYLGAIAFGFYNAYLNGETGQSIGKKMQNIKVVSIENGQTIGGGNGIVRYLCHVIDGCTCGIGYIYGLFIDKDKQTIADKVVKTVVVKA